MPSYWGGSGAGFGGGGQTPWAQNVDAAGHSLNNIPQLSNGASGITLQSAGTVLIPTTTTGIGPGISTPLGTVQIRSSANENLVLGTLDWLVPGAVGVNCVNDANSAAILLGLLGSPILLRGGNVSIGTATAPTHLLELSSDSAAKPSTNTWTISSDMRTKRNVRRFEGDIEVVRKLDPIVAEYNGLGGTPKGQRVVSFDAAELRKLVPPCVSAVRGKLHESDAEETELLGVNTHELFFHLLRAVQDIDRRLQGMERNGGKRK